MKNKDNAVWVVSKAKVHFNKFPSWRDVIKGRCYTTKIKPIRVEVETAFKNIDNKRFYYDTILSYFHQLNTKDALISDEDLISNLIKSDLYHKNVGLHIVG